MADAAPITGKHLGAPLENVETVSSWLDQASTLLNLVAEESGEGRMTNVLYAATTLVRMSFDRLNDTAVAMLQDRA